jgi:hypothetical protein
MSDTQSKAAVEAPALELVLKYPFTNAAGQRIEKLTFRRGKRGDMVAAARYSKDEIEQEGFLFARLAGVTVEDIDALDLADAKELTEFFREKLAG